MTIRNSNPNAFTYSDECLAYSATRSRLRSQINEQVEDIRDIKKRLVKAYAENRQLSASSAQSDLHYARVAAHKTNKEITDTKAAWKELLASGHQYRVPAEALQAAE